MDWPRRFSPATGRLTVQRFVELAAGQRHVNALGSSLLARAFRGRA
jgi:hypothetical protein